MQALQGVEVTWKQVEVRKWRLYEALVRHDT